MPYSWSNPPHGNDQSIFCPSGGCQVCGRVNFSMSITAPPASTTLASSALPLTTIFTPPYSCLQSWNTVPFTSESANTSYNLLGPIDGRPCLPTGWKPDTYFSPGLCPQNYTIATSTVDTTLTETRAQCCPKWVEHILREHEFGIITELLQQWL